MIFIKKCINIIIMLLFCMGSHAMEGDPRDKLVEGEYLIRWSCKREECEKKKCECDGLGNTYLFVEEEKFKGKVVNNLLKGEKKWGRASIFTLRKNQQGFLIKNVKYDLYIYIASGQYKEGAQDDDARVYSNIMSGSYFNILKPDPVYQLEEGVYLIKNDRSSDYLRLPKSQHMNDQRDVRYGQNEDGHCFFSFVRPRDASFDNND